MKKKNALIKGLILILFGIVFLGFEIGRVEYPFFAFDGGVDAIVTPDITINHSESQIIVMDSKYILSGLKIRVVTWDTPFIESDYMLLKLTDISTGEVIDLIQNSLIDAPNNEWFHFDMKDIVLESGHIYKFEFNSSLENSINALALMRSDNTQNQFHYAYSNGEKCNYDLSIILMGTREVK